MLNRKVGAILGFKEKVLTVAKECLHEFTIFGF